MKKMRYRLTALLFCLLLGCSSSDQDGTAPSLNSLEALAGNGNSLFPEFDPAIFHYGIQCSATQAVTVHATASNSNDFVSIASNTPKPGEAEVNIKIPQDDHDLHVDVHGEDGSQRYVIHCLPPDLPEISIDNRGASGDQHALYISPRANTANSQYTYLMVLDDNYVPRFTRRIDGSAFDFKRHPDGRHSYQIRTGRNEFGINDGEVVILDSEFAELERLATVDLTQTDVHDFLFTEEGHRLFISYHTTIRDMTAFGLSEQEQVGDSVIQEVKPDGEVVFEWNSWDHIDLNNCTGFRQFPSDYAHLNSLNLTKEGDIIASFRGCSQVFKIDRPTGNVVWRFGGADSDFQIVGDHLAEFCGQHTAFELPDNRLIMFDNGIFCLGDREATFGQVSRIVEYRLDKNASQANFERDYFLNGDLSTFTRSQGAVTELANGDWLVSWGNGPDVSITQVDVQNNEKLRLSARVDGEIAISYRAYKYPISELEE